MRHKLHFISGLPRSGSTLLGALLRQNPRFHASMSSGLHTLVAANLNIMSAGSEVSKLMDESQRPTILRALFDAYYDRLKDKAVVFDTNRSWCGRMPLIRALFSEAKVIACVRDVPWIMDSLERLYRKNPFEKTRLFPADGQGNVYARMESLARQDRLVGHPWAALKEAFYGDEAESLLVVDYELLARAPEDVLRLVYNFVGEPWFEGHNYNNVEYDAPEFDESLGVKGLHTVRRKVSFESRPTILPPDLFEKFKGMDFWTDLKASRANVITPTKSNESAT